MFTFYQQILCAIDLYRTKPNFNGCEIAHVYDEGPDFAKQLDICSLSPKGSLVFVRGEMLECALSYFMPQN